MALTALVRFSPGDLVSAGYILLAMSTIENHPNFLAIVEELHVDAIDVDAFFQSM